jgi:bifunctional non-homologous end joining protein LigD
VSTSRVPAVSPMHPTLVREPFHQQGWVYEEKVDGWRMLAYKTGGAVRLVSRNGVDHTARFRDIATMILRMPSPTLVLDGEVAVYDQKLVSRFDMLADPDDGLVITPPLLMVFDLLHARGRDLRERPLSDRRQRLERELRGADFVYPVRRLADDGMKAWAQVLERRFEGLVAKDPESFYTGGRTRLWLKVKRPGAIASHSAPAWRSPERRSSALR